MPWWGGCGLNNQYLKQYIFFFTFSILWLLFGVNDKLLTQHILGLLTKYKLLYVSNHGRIGAGLGLGLRVMARS